MYARFMTRSRTQHCGLRVHRIALFASLLALSVAASCFGDQLQWTPLSVCRDAAKMIARQPLLLSYCSQADEDYVELWLVRDLEVVATPAPRLHEVTVIAKRLYRSDRAFSSEDFPVSEEQWVFSKAEDPRRFVVGIDLAYVYLYVGGGSFQCLAQVLGLPCVVGVDAIPLPDHVLENAVAQWCEAKRHTPPWLPQKPLERSHQAGR
jgi:hypothetical protein